MAFTECLQSTWRTLYATTLPDLARNRDPAQPMWPVTLDHCFARIILDNTVGRGQEQWDNVIKKPAVQTMTEAQLIAAIELGEMIRTGEANLVELDEKSLRCRGKKSKAMKRKRGDEEIAPMEGAHQKKQKSAHRQSVLCFVPRGEKIQLSVPTVSESSQTGKAMSEENHSVTLLRIQTHPTLTPYRERLYTALLSVPRGRYTTYAALSDYLHSSARAVGNGMRNNPFAPDVPCHRVLAADGSIGGFGGSWGKDGQNAGKKIALLQGEGVRFDGRGKVLGDSFKDFHDFKQVNGENQKA